MLEAHYQLTLIPLSQSSLGNHQREYESDLSMLEQQERNQIVWRDQIFDQTKDIPRIIKEVR